MERVIENTGLLHNKTLITARQANSQGIEDYSSPKSQGPLHDGILARDPFMMGSWLGEA